MVTGCYNVNKGKGNRNQGNIWKDSQRRIHVYIDVYIGQGVI